MYPSELILATHEQVTKLQELAVVLSYKSHPQSPESVCLRPWFVSDIIAEVVECLRFMKTAPRQLQELVEEIACGQCHSGAGYVPEQFAQAVGELGTVIYTQLAAARAYSTTGYLLYGIRSSIEPCESTDLILKFIQNIALERKAA